MTEERWLPVVGFEGSYEVSDQGRVRSLDRVVVCSGAVKGTYSSLKKGRVLRPGRMPGGHQSVVLGRNAGSVCVHKMVLEAFVGPAPKSHEARHLDGDPSANRLTNLEWATRGRNTQDKKWHNGTISAKLYPEAIIRLKQDIRNSRLGPTALANKFGVHKSTIYAVKYGKFHKDVVI